MNDRITIGLNVRSQAALDRRVAETGMSKTDLVNRAILLEEIVAQEEAKGNQLAFMDSSGVVVRHHII